MTLFLFRPTAAQSCPLSVILKVTWRRCPKCRLRRVKLLYGAVRCQRLLLVLSSHSCEVLGPRLSTCRWKASPSDVRPCLLFFATPPQDTCHRCLRGPWKAYPTVARCCSISMPPQVILHRTAEICLEERVQLLNRCSPSMTPPSAGLWRLKCL